LVNRVTGGKALPTELIKQIVAKTDGVSLFVEELTKTVLESGFVREEGGSYVIAEWDSATRSMSDPMRRGFLASARPAYVTSPSWEE
jgi:hypothetical protein